MGTTYNFVCKTCKKNYDIDKIHNARWMYPLLSLQHTGHEYGVYGENSDVEIYLAFVESGEYQQLDGFKELINSYEREQMSESKFTEILDSASNLIERVK